MSRLLVVFIALLALLSSTNALSRNASPSDQLRFFLLGDWGSAGLGEDDTQVQVSIGMAKVATNFLPQFVISVGDNFYDNGVKSIADPLWNQDWLSIYNQDSLKQLPWYVVLGNHDYLGSVQSQLDYSKKNSRWIFPSRYYLKTMTLPDAQNTTVDFVFIDTNPFTLDPDDLDQWKWIEKVLPTLQSDWKIIVGHHPVIACGKDEGEDFDRFQNRLKDLLDKFNINLYLCGHRHNLQYLTQSNTNYFVSGSGGRLSEVKHKCKEQEGNIVNYFSENGFMSFTLENGQVAVTMYDSTGEDLYDVTIPRNANTRKVSESASLAARRVQRKKILMVN